MKNLKKIASLLLALVMVFSLAITASAADAKTDQTTETDGTVKVTNANEAQTYTLYLLFKADVGQNDTITYTADNIDLTGNAWFELNDNGFVVAKNGVDVDWAKDPEAIAWAKNAGTQIGEPLKGDAAKSTGWTDLEYGYYFVDTTLGAFIGVDSANKNAVIREKNEEPKIDKEIVSVDGSTSSLGVGDDTTDPGSGANEKAIAEIGDSITYKLTVKAKAGAENYIVTDTLSAGLTPPTVANVTVSAGTGNYSVNVTGQVITVTFTKAYLDSIEEDADITIEYTATLNENATVGDDGNGNTAELTWGHDTEEDTNTSTDEAKVYTASMTVTKEDQNGNKLEGAGFVIAKTEGEGNNAVTKYYKIANNVVTWVDSIDDATEYTSDANGAVTAFTGLANGTYTLVEKTVPAGYNKVADQDFTIAENNYTADNLEQAATVINNAGSVLPSTGGIGTTLFYVFGGILVAAAVVLLVTKKRMSTAE